MEKLAGTKKYLYLCTRKTEKHRGVEQLVARQAHNLEVARSNPASATLRSPIHSGFFRFAPAEPFTCSRSPFFAERSVPSGRARILPPQLMKLKSLTWVSYVYTILLPRKTNLLPPSSFLEKQLW